jgi:hypothetical protein
VDDCSDTCDYEIPELGSKALVAGDIIPPPPKESAVKKTNDPDKATIVKMHSNAICETRGEPQTKSPQLAAIEFRTVHLEDPSVLDSGEKSDAQDTAKINENHHITVNVIEALLFVAGEPTVPHVFDPKLIRTSFNNLCKASCPLNKTRCPLTQ